jgi:hypothetical protein
LDECDSSLGFQIRDLTGFANSSEFDLNLFENTHRIVNSLENHSKFYRSPKIMKLGPKFVIFLPHHGK